MEIGGLTIDGGLTWQMVGYNQIRWANYHMVGYNGNWRANSRWWANLANGGLQSNLVGYSQIWWAKNQMVGYNGNWWANSPMVG